MDSETLKFVNDAVRLMHQTLIAQQQSIKDLGETVKLQTEMLRMLDKRIQTLEQLYERNRS